jgi:hypothetical protein
VSLDRGAMDDLEAAWAELHDATPPNWFVGQPAFNEYRDPPWEQYAFDTSERPKIGHRGRERTAVGMTEAHCVQTMAYCLREIGAGRVPK